jgi:hypothetical protein
VAACSSKKRNTASTLLSSAKLHGAPAIEAWEHLIMLRLELRKHETATVPKRRDYYLHTNMSYPAPNDTPAERIAGPVPPEGKSS